jgi:hypothetical protein
MERIDTNLHPTRDFATRGRLLEEILSRCSEHELECFNQFNASAVCRI